MAHLMLVAAMLQSLQETSFGLLLSKEATKQTTTAGKAGEGVDLHRANAGDSKS